MVEQRFLKSKLYSCIFSLFYCLLSLVSCAGTQKNIKADTILIDNQVKECIEIMPNSIAGKNGSAYINAKIKSIKSIGYCGCKSALLSYRVYGIKGNDKTMLHYDSFSSLVQGGYDFYVGNGSMNNYDRLKIDIQCKNPD